MVFSMITTRFLTEIRSIPLIPAQQADAFSDSLILSRRSCRIRIYEKPLKWELIKRLLLCDHGGERLPAKAAFPDSFSYGNEAVETVSYDPEGAKKLLEESGWKDTDGDGYADKDGQKLTIDWLTYPTRLEQPKLAEYAQATLKEIGIDVVVNNTSDHMTYAADGNFDVYVSSTTTAPTGDPEYFFTSTVVDPKTTEI